MYANRFGLAEDPFKLTPSLRFLYRGRNFEASFEALRDALLEDRRLALLESAPGLGKTALLRLLAEELRGRGVDCALEACGAWTTADALLAPAPAVLLLDEAQNLVDAELALLLQRADAGGVRLAFAASPDFAARLARPDALRRRLRPLPRREVAAYVRERVVAVGGSETLFGADALALIAVAARGVPRLVNRICSTSLFMAAMAQEDGVSAARIAETLATLGVAPPAGRSVSPAPEPQPPPPPEATPEAMPAAPGEPALRPVASPARPLPILMAERSMAADRRLAYPPPRRTRRRGLLAAATAAGLSLVALAALYFNPELIAPSRPPALESPAAGLPPLDSDARIMAELAPEAGSPTLPAAPPAPPPAAAPRAERIPEPVVEPPKAAPAAAPPPRAQAVAPPAPVEATPAPAEPAPRAAPEPAPAAAADARPQAPQPSGEPPPREPPVARDPAARALEQARRRLADGHLVEPAGESALDAYRRALALEPESEAAQQGVADLADRLVGLAEEAEARGDWIAAVEDLERAEAIAPDNPRAAALRERRRMAAAAVAPPQSILPPAPAPPAAAPPRRAAPSTRAVPPPVAATPAPPRPPAATPGAPLERAALDSVARLQDALAAGADPNTVYDGMRRPLTIAARNRRPDVVSTLLRHGADPNVETHDSSTPLIYAAWNGDLVTTTFLLEAGAQADMQNLDRKTALMAAAARGHAAVAELLLRNGADPDAQNIRGWTALMYAAWEGHRDVVRLLLQRGANSSIRNADGYTAALLAEMRQPQSGGAPARRMVN